MIDNDLKEALSNQKRDDNIRILPLFDKPQNKDQAVSWVNSLSVSDFPAAQMSAENLLQVMEHFEINRVNDVNEG